MTFSKPVPLHWVQVMKERSYLRGFAPGGITRPGGWYFPLPPHLAQGKRTSLTPWQFVQRSLPSPRQFGQIAAALIDLASAARWSLSRVVAAGMAFSAATGRSNPFFFAWARPVSA